MINLNADGAAVRMLSLKTNIPGECLHTVALAYGNPTSIGPGPHPVPNAQTAWVYAVQQPNQSFVVDHPVFLGPSPTRTDADKNAGDVMIYHGNGLFVASDSPRLGAGKVGLCTLAERLAQTRRPVNGWTTTFLGYELTGTALADVGGGTIITPASPVTEDDVSYSIVKDAQSDAEYVCSLVSPHKAHIESTYHTDLLRRYKAGDPGMLAQEQAICMGYIAAINPAPSVNVAASFPTKINLEGSLT